MLKCNEVLGVGGYGQLQISRKSFERDYSFVYLLVGGQVGRVCWILNAAINANGMIYVRSNCAMVIIYQPIEIDYLRFWDKNVSR